MKQDARRLDHKTLEEMRIRAVRQVQSGVSPEDITRSLGLSHPTIYNWLASYRDGGMQALKAKPVPGRPSRITGPMMKWIYDTIVQKSPLQFRFEFALWTREMIREVIFKKYKLRLGLSSVSRLLKQLGLSCQRPIFKAWQQNEQQVKNWLKRFFRSSRPAPSKRKRIFSLPMKQGFVQIFTAEQHGLRSVKHPL
ncbi:MAG: transposase [Bdellovibrionales bacterium]|nr:transposase [Bdellovibrionales bacterium]